MPTRKSNTAAPRTSLCDKAYNDIKRRILTNQISPGNMIDDRKIALEIGMSRTPVREALLRLQAEELVEMSPRRGTIVLGISRDDMREIYDIISGLELMAVDLIANQKPDVDDLAPLTDAIKAMREADAKNNIDAVVDADESFHRGLLVLSKNNRLADIGLRYRDLIQRAHLLAVRLRPAERIENSIGAHQQLFDLLVKGDALAAREAHYHQRVEAGNELIETLANYNLNNL